MLIDDEKHAAEFLEAVSFFRLTPYMRPFQHNTDAAHEFRSGTRMSSLTRLYDFDRRLRLLVMDAVEHIEVAARAALSNYMGPHHGAHWYMDPRVFRHDFRHQALIDTILRKQEISRRDYERECSRIDQSNTLQTRITQLKKARRKESYARHYGLTYDQPALMPGWAAMEEITFGELSHLFKGLARATDKKAVARTWGLPAPLVESWLHTLTTVRNICAHHARLWNRELGIRPELAKAASCLGPAAMHKAGAPARIFTIVCIITLLIRRIRPMAGWEEALHILILDFPDVDLTAMGFPMDWRQDIFWGAVRC